MTSNSYPNLMCFGRDITNCPLQDRCPDYQACNERYGEDWLKLFESTEGAET